MVNPSKLGDLGGVKADVAGVVDRFGATVTGWFETRREDPGAAATRAALDRDPDLVCAMGGDGTVRAVAAILRGTRVPCGILPHGTGNLLARNLGIPVDHLDAALEIAVTGRDRAIDLGLATFDDGVERVFVVMGGVGLDAEVMAHTDDRLKQKVGWGAYVVAGGRSLVGSGFETVVIVDGARQAGRSCVMLLACNCGSVVANFEVARHAVVSDGLIELVMLRTKLVGGWLGAAVDAAAHFRHGQVSLHQRSGRDVRFQLDRPVPAEIDGDPVGLTRSGRFAVDPLALVVRVPGPAQRSAGKSAQ